LSDIKSRFRIRNGEIEIEYEGPLREVNLRYESAFEWLTSTRAKKIGKREEKKAEEKGKKEKRGGARRPIYGSKIEELIAEGFFEKRKSLDDVTKGLVPKNVPTRGFGARNAIIGNLRRKIAKKDAKLKGAKEEGTWYFWVD